MVQTKTHTKIAWILALTVGGIFFLVLSIRFPTINLGTMLTHLTASVLLGAIVFFITYGLGSLIVGVKRRLK